MYIYIYTYIYIDVCIISIQCSLHEGLKLAPEQILHFPFGHRVASRPLFLPHLPCLKSGFPALQVFSVGRCGGLYQPLQTTLTHQKYTGIPLDNFAPHPPARPYESCQNIQGLAPPRCPFEIGTTVVQIISS